MRLTASNHTANTFLFDWSLFIKTLYSRNDSCHSRILQTLNRKKNGTNTKDDTYLYQSAEMEYLIKMLNMSPIQLLNDNFQGYTTSEQVSSKLNTLEIDLLWLKEFTIELNERNRLKAKKLENRVKFLEKEISRLRQSHPPIITKLNNVEIDDMINESESFANETFYNDTFYSCV